MGYFCIFFFYIYVFLFFSFNISALESIEYIYPVARLVDNTNTVLAMHQRSEKEIALVVYDNLGSSNNINNNREYRSFLSPQFCPTKVCLLPDGTGFSFFDNGMLKVQAFLKRYPRTIEILYPLSYLQDIEWESPHVFYVSACHKKRNALFRADTRANINFMIFSLTSDFLCPQKRASELFFIDRSCDKSPAKYHFSSVKFDGSFAVDKKKLKNKKQEDKIKKYFSQVEYLDSIECCDLDRIQLLIDFEDQPIISLAMDSDVEGAAIGYETNTEKPGESFVFFYYFLYKNNNGDWQKKLLFSFSLPKNLFLGNGENQLIESIFPLLPKKIGTIIYYSSLVGNKVNLFTFLPEAGMSRQLTFASQTNEHYFCPIMIDSSLYCGQTIINKNQKVCLYPIM